MVMTIVKNEEGGIKTKLCSRKKRRKMNPYDSLFGREAGEAKGRAGESPE
jgi:hypothetical protein